MKDSSKAKQELLEELSILKKKIRKMEKSATNLKEIDDELRDSEAFAKTLFNDSHIPLIVMDAETGRYIDCNKAAVRIYGYETRDEVLGKTPLDVSAPVQYDGSDSATEAKKHIQAGCEKGSHVFEWRHQRPDGQTWDADVHLMLLQHRGKSLIQFTLQDITERRRMEDAIRENEALFSVLLEHSPVYVFFKDKDLRSLRLSKNYEQMLGIPVHQALGKTMNELFPSDFAARMVVDDLKILNDGKCVVVEEEFNGRIYETTKFPIFKDAEPIMLVGFTVDITEHKQMEKALRQSEEILRNVFKAVPVGLCIMKDRVFQNVNRAYFENLGYSDSEIIGHTPRLLYENEKEYERVGRELFANLLERGLTSVQTKHRRKDGSIREVVLTAVPLQMKEASSGMEVVTVQDITDRRRAEEERQALEERLQRAEKMEALGLLAGGVAHDLNNVIGIIVGYAELISDDIDESSPMRKKLLNIMEGGQRAAAIVQDLLTLARRGVAGRKVLNVNRLILNFDKLPEWEKLHTYHPLVQLKTDLEPDLLNISASSVHLHKTLFNLVSNASESMPKGGLLTIKTSNQYLDKPVHGYDNIQEGDYVVLSVSDTGEGIPEQDLKRIFEPFYTKKIMGRSGTGLGLAVVWGTVKDHQGYIDVQSGEGKGTTFTLYFPVIREDVTAEAASISMLEYMGRGESILVVDDVRGQRDLAVAMLKKFSYTVTSVSSGEEALEYLKKNKVDLLVLDMIMEPGMDGLDTYKKVLEIHSQQKAIIVSGFSESDRVYNAQALGAGAYVKKPYVQETLGMAVKNELDRK
ncbi:MAG: PAS domain S-box protein [Smithellaceae bacterium]